MVFGIIFWLCFISFVDLISLFAFAGGEIEHDFFLYDPRTFYKETSMNWFGCWVSFIFFQLISPIGSIIRLIVFLFHIGRND